MLMVARGDRAEKLIVARHVRFEEYCRLGPA